MERRFFLIVLDGCGAGSLPDAGPGDDLGASTLCHTAHAVGGLRLPNLERLGFGNIVALEGVAPRPEVPSWWGRLSEASRGKDSVTGHWEMMGIVTDPPLPTYPEGFPAEMLARFAAETGLHPLGGFPASGTEILKALGEAHLATGRPIVYTSADSVLQVAAHETHFGLERLYALCKTARRLFPVGRVIARPFVGESASTFVRTQNRRDWPLAPPGRTTLDALADAGRRVHLIGRPGEFFPEASGQTRETTTANPAHGAAVGRAVRAGDADFVFASFEDFDMLCGHRNDPKGFAVLLESFDAWLGADFLPFLRPGDLVGLTADHGNDPTTPSTDHSREFTPLLLFGGPVDRPRAMGDRASFADWGATLCDWLGVEKPGIGESLLGCG